MNNEEYVSIRKKLSESEQETANQMAELLSEENQVYLEHYLGMISTTLEQGGELTNAQKGQITALISTYDVLPDEMKKRVEDALAGIGITFDKNGKVLYTDAEGTAREIIAGWESSQLEEHLSVDPVLQLQIDMINRRRPEMQKAAEEAGMAVVDGLLIGLGSKFEALQKKSGEVIGVIDTVTKKKYEIRSPSRLMRRLGGYITEGFALGLKDNDTMVENASKLVTRIPEEEMNKLSRRAQAAGAMTLPTASPQAARAQSIDMNAFASVMVKALKDAGLTVQMDAKTVGYLTAPAVGKQLGFDAKRGKRN